MKRSIAVLLSMILMVGSFCASSAETLTGSRLYLAFGLFSVQTDTKSTNVQNTGNELGDLRYELDAFPELVYANYAPLESYEQTAQRKLNSYISYLYAVVCHSSNYSETDVTEETLSNGIRIRWQLMRGDKYHALWFEAFTENMGYNICVYSEATDEQDGKMLSLMRSFEVNANMEQDLMLKRQTANGDGSFISVDHGLRIQLDETWKPVEIDSLLLDNSALILEKEEGACLIQLLHLEPYEESVKQDLFKWYVQNYGQGYDEEKVYTINLDGLGVTAIVLDAEANIYLKQVAFVYQNRAYFGSFMWIKPLDAQMRPFMDAALKSLKPGFVME